MVGVEVGGWVRVCVCVCVCVITQCCKCNVDSRRLLRSPDHHWSRLACFSIVSIACEASSGAKQTHGMQERLRAQTANCAKKCLHASSSVNEQPPHRIGLARKMNIRYLLQGFIKNRVIYS